MLKAGLLARSRRTEQCVVSPEAPRRTLDIQTPQTSVVNCSVVNLAHIAKGHSQKKDVSPVVVNCYHQRNLKYVKDVSFVTQLSFVKPVTNCCLKSSCRGKTSKLLGNLGSSGCRSESVKNSKTRLHPPLWTRPNLTRSLTIISSYANPHRNLSVGGSLSVSEQKYSRACQKSKICGLLQQTFLGSKTQQPMETYTRSEQFKSIPQGGKFKIETPETIRTSLQQGEWVTSIDFKDAYFHIPMQELSREYLRFHIQSQSYQFKALPFRLSTAPMEFTVTAKEVKLMAIHKGIRIHQYLDDWLVRARSYQACLQYTQELVEICQKSELDRKQVFNFIGYQFNLICGRV